MTTKNFLKTFIACNISAGFLLQGCSDVSVITKGEISSLQADTTVLLQTQNHESPHCNVVIDFMYLKPSSNQDSLSNQINQTLQRLTFGTDYTNFTPAEAINKSIDNYINSYRKDLLAYYEADLKKGITKEEMPPWYNYQYNITSELSIARDSIYNYAVTNFQFTGGAHPNTFAKWTNINANTGKELKKSDIFVENSDEEIIKLIGKHLLEEANKRLETDTISSLQGLEENGILLNVDLYVPENFLITNEGVKFLYNRYDIAPYVVGDFQLNIPYAEIENLMKIK